MAEEPEKLKKRSLVDDEAEEEEKPSKIRKVDDEDGDDAGSDDQEDVEDQDDGDDHYEADDFLIADDELHPDDDEDEEDGENFEDNESADENEVAESRTKKRSRLFKQKKNLRLDEDDMLLIQDQNNERKPSKKTAARSDQDAILPEDEPDDDKSFVEESKEKDDVVEPEEVGSDDDGLGDFIADRKKPAQGTKKRTFKKDKDGPTFDQLEDARAIFGDGYDDGDFDDENYEQDMEKVGGLRDQDKAGGKGIAKAQYEYIQLVQTFCLDEDEEIRRADIPERFQLMTKEYLQNAGSLSNVNSTNNEISNAGANVDMEVDDADGIPVVKKPTPVFIRSFSDLDRSLEAIWIASQLMTDYQKEDQCKNPPKPRLFEQPKIAVIYDRNYDLPPELPPKVSFQRPEEEKALIDCVKQILIYFQVDFLEVPYIFLYKQDYLLPYFTRNTLWKIYFYHEQYCQLLLTKDKTVLNIEDLSKIVQAYDKHSKRPGGNKVTIPENFQHLVFHPSVLAVDNTLQTQEDETTQYLKNGVQEWWKKFPVDLYSRLLEDATDEMFVHDILSYIRLLGQGHYFPTEEEAVAEERAKQAEESNKNNDDDVFDEDEDEFFRSMNMPTEEKKSAVLTGSKSDVTAASAGLSQRRQTKLNKYGKYKNNPYLRTFVNLLVHPAYEIASSITTSQELISPMTLDNICNPEEVAKQFSELCNFKNPAELFYHAGLVIATEVSLEPVIRKEAREIFRSRGSISTRPTKRGLQMITPFSEYFGIHYLDQKPLRDIYGNTEGLLMFMQIIDAEQQGLITLKIHPPQKLESNQYSNDNTPFLFGSLKLMSKYLPHTPRQSELTGDATLWKDAWDLVRLNALQLTIEKHILPLIEGDVRKELIRLGKDEIIHEMTRKFEQRLSIGPYRVPQTESGQAIADLLLSCPLPTVYENVVGIFLSAEDGIYGHLVQILSDGIVGQTLVIAKQGKGQIRDKVKTFLYDTKPGLIVINSSSGYQGKELANLLEKFIVGEINETLELDYSLQKAKKEQQKTLLGRRSSEDDDESEEEEKAEESDDDEPLRRFQPQVIIADDDLANIVKASPASKTLYPELTADSIAAASLARFAQEPLTEYAILFKCVDSTFLFGYEVLYLQLHPLQKMVNSHKRKIVKWLESRLVNAVSDLGVNLNQAMKYGQYYGLLPFVAGLGPRKADLLKHQIQTLESASIPNRKYLYTSKLLSGTIYTNSAGFLKIFPPGVTQQLIRHIDGIPTNTPVNLEVLFDNDKLFPLDITRIHPEFYNVHDYAPKICADALEVDCNPSHITDIVKRLMKSVRKDLEKRIKRYPRWLELWGYGQRVPQGVLDADDDPTIRPPDRRFTIELNDSLAQLVLQEYAKDLQAQGHGKRRLIMELIKNELRYPFVDLRAPLTSMLNTPRYFDLSNGVNDYTLFVGLHIGCTVLELKDDVFLRPSRRDDRDEEVRVQKAFVRTDNNLRGVISMYEVTDERVDSSANTHFRIQDHLTANSHVIAVIIGIDKLKNQVELSIKPSRMKCDEAWWLANRNSEPCMLKWYDKVRGINNPAKIFDYFFSEELALQEYTKEHTIDTLPAALSIASTGNNGHNGGQTAITASSGVNKKGIVSRVIYHPLFANVDFKEAEERLKLNGRAGAVVIRPSSKGPNYLTITWAFQPQWYKHISVLEKGKKPGELGLGKELYIQENDLENRPYADLDEIFATYIEPMNEFVAAMVKYRNFRSQSTELVEEEMKKESKQNPHRIPYFIRFEPQKPGIFVLTWLNPHTSSIKTLRIEVRPEGYKIGTENFSSPSSLIVWFKQMNEHAVANAAASSSSGKPNGSSGTSRGGGGGHGHGHYGSGAGHASNPYSSGGGGNYGRNIPPPPMPPSSGHYGNNNPRSGGGGGAPGPNNYYGAGRKY